MENRFLSSILQRSPNGQSRKPNLQLALSPMGDNLLVSHDLETKTKQNKTVEEKEGKN